jgi:DNA-binding CsgD family transcriptional regulator
MFSFGRNSLQITWKGLPMADAPIASIEDLVRALLTRRPASAGHYSEVQQDPHAEEIMFDAEVDGTRYLFVRLPKPVQLPTRLSPREQEIVRLVALGHSNKIIAGVLNISSWTVCTHLRRIFAKLGVGSRAAMVALMPDIRRTSVSAWTDPEAWLGESNTGENKARSRGAPISAHSTG